MIYLSIPEPRTVSVIQVQYQEPIYEAHYSGALVDTVSFLGLFKYTKTSIPFENVTSYSIEKTGIDLGTQDEYHVKLCKVADCKDYYGINYIEPFVKTPVVVGYETKCCRPENITVTKTKWKWLLS